MKKNALQIIVAAVLALAGAYFEYRLRLADADRRHQWRYSEYLHEQTGATTAPADLWEDGK